MEFNMDLDEHLRRTRVDCPGCNKRLRDTAAIGTVGLQQEPDGRTVSFGVCHSCTPVFGMQLAKVVKRRIRKFALDEQLIPLLAEVFRDEIELH